jgi:hypothetical protein
VSTSYSPLALILQLLNPRHASPAVGETEDSFTKAPEELDDTLSAQEGQANDPDEAQAPPSSGSNGVEMSKPEETPPASSSANKVFV